MKMTGDWDLITFFAAVTILFILFGGSPDLMDAIVYALTDGNVE